MEKWDETYRASLPFIDKIKGRSFTEFIELIQKIDKTVYVPLAKMPREPNLAAQLEVLRGIAVYTCMITNPKGEYLGYVISNDKTDFYYVLHRFMEESNMSYLHTKH